ncbi:phosphatidate cytidylyltransferase [Sphingoaurantiacus capsulatus]|uniref:Phosphatidate cytidylyltransferase n=1 Tax=Sphingoaurantiacus capsulatus TaxID=1771310 RepID=A0ABV7XG03_9SPHN
MAITDPLPSVTDSPPPSGLWTRIAVAVPLIAIALFAVMKGELWFTALVSVGVLLIFAEWAVMHGIPRQWRLIGLVVLAAGCFATELQALFPAILGLLAAAGVLGILARLFKICDAKSMAGGLLYAGLPAIALIWLRDQPQGLGLVVWVLTLVWATDIFAYFAGRTIGGPKIAPKISPKKTWAGLVGGVIGAMVVGWFVARWALFPAALFASLSGGLAVVSQAGDFFESWLKRRVGVKDSGTLLPGHGGIMDRVDGLVPVAVLVAAALILKDLWR